MLAVHGYKMHFKTMLMVVQNRLLKMLNLINTSIVFHSFSFTLVFVMMFTGNWTSSLYWIRLTVLIQTSTMI
jgi:hypothetical protein